MHLINPPTTLEDAIAQLTERTHQLDCARHDCEQARAQSAKLREALTVARELALAQAQYMVLLGEELDELIPPASSHGWKSTRYEKGVECRRTIDELTAKLSATAK